ncbi:hypothetical protein CkaCkLH20_04940 [Colletotrichum karsti]|uniref:Uncharacterized protein n=1 Tax=Colletotrichum karsti TaxID=1095194 RepID=A0A9P6I8D9_9PEZI|nr:uncharacterized protein CkaCkLH20_04940 [Colletotrichum karsti]KAF9877805.1 hypothetical protein CkaCkLH20_04940 [Colletotrichum karsti]
MSGVSDKAIINGDIPRDGTAAEDQEARERENGRVESFLEDNNGPVPLFGQDATTVGQRHAEKAAMINEVVANADR